MIPEKKSKYWYFILFCYTIIVFIGIIVTRIIVNTQLSFQLVLGSIILALISGLIPSIAGFWGRRVFYSVFTCINIAALFYMFYVVTMNTSPGWGDLTSIIGYLFIVILGFIIALVSEIVYFFLKKKTN